MSQIFTKGLYHHNISLVLITQNLFHQGPLARVISLKSKYIIVFKNPRDMTEIVHFARQVYPENISSFYKTYLEVCKNLCDDLTEAIYDLLRYRTKTFQRETTEVFAPYTVMNRLKS